MLLAAEQSTHPSQGGKRRGWAASGACLAPLQSPGPRHQPVPARARALCTRRRGAADAAASIGAIRDPWRLWGSELCGRPARANSGTQKRVTCQESPSKWLAHNLSAYEACCPLHVVGSLCKDPALDQTAWLSLKCKAPSAQQHKSDGWALMILLCGERYFPMQPWTDAEPERLTSTRSADACMDLAGRTAF